jgi:hypothetical protein
MNGMDAEGFSIFVFVLIGGAILVLSAVDRLRGKKTNWRGALGLLVFVPLTAYVHAKLVEAGVNLQLLQSWIWRGALIAIALLVALVAGSVAFVLWKRRQILKRIKGRERVELRTMPDCRRFCDCPSCGAEVEVSPMEIGAPVFTCKVCGFSPRWKG